MISLPIASDYLVSSEKSLLVIPSHLLPGLDFFLKINFILKIFLITKFSFLSMQRSNLHFSEILRRCTKRISLWLPGRYPLSLSMFSFNLHFADTQRYTKEGSLFATICRPFCPCEASILARYTKRVSLHREIADVVHCGSTASLYIIVHH